MPRGISALSLHTLHSQYCGPLIYNMAEDGTGGGDAKGDKGGDEKKDDGQKGDDKGKGDDGKKDDGVKGRISDLVREKNELESKLAKYEQDQKTASEAKMKEEGKLKELLDAKERELADISGKHKSASDALTAYEKTAADKIAKQLESIKDEKKRESVKKLLEGRPVLEQFALAEEAIALAGGSGDFGAPTPAGGEVDTATKKKRYAELLAKRDQTPSERAEFRKLMTELSQFAQGDKGAFDSQSS